MSHNYPSDVAKPSVVGHHITKHLQDALLLLEVRTLGHIVLGHGESKGPVTVYPYVFVD
ncbi:JAB domain-containing protein [Serratia fonticola]|uniref:JAB domain-containing protein n=1 Tax=Serratia fonticola TaxID=47917 RepID=UPI003CC7F27E